ncbi:MAG: 3-deoxy-D-manno-octulosonic acid transferase, partial [Nitrospirae bacterium]|nr:3-deoxy-D-manno-octulosonic acid transferase [Nitrospirota bacterium]
MPLSVPSNHKTIWIHAVSVGETIASAPLIKKIKARYPNVNIIISTVTDTGQKIANERVANLARVIYAPFDMPFAVRRAAMTIMPSLFIIMETELWPNTIRTLKNRGASILLMNGRISKSSFEGYKKLRFFIRDVLRNIDGFCMQNDVYAERILVLGALPQSVKSIGSFKFDTAPSNPLPDWTSIFRGQKTVDGSQGLTIIAGSTHRTEEALVIDAYLGLKSDFPDINLILAPRHPERFKEVEELIKKKGVKYFKRSDITAHSSRITGIVILLDVIGELASVYGACDIAVIGGSFIKHGGQNPLEPAYWGTAIVCGPHMENFPFIEEFYKNGGAVKTETGNLSETLKQLLSSPEKILKMGRIA